MNDQILDNKGNNYLAAVHVQKNQAGAAFLDISTGEFYVAEGHVDYIAKLINNYNPNEILYQRSRDKEFQEKFKSKTYTFRLDDWAFEKDFTTEKLLTQFGTKSLKGFGIEKLDLAIISAGVFYITLIPQSTTRLATLLTFSVLKKIITYGWMILPFQI